MITRLQKPTLLKMLLLGAAALLPATLGHAAQITFVGHQDGVELDADDPAVGWRNASPAKTLDIDGDDILGTDGYALPGLKSSPGYATITTIAPKVKSGSTYGAWDDPAAPSGSDALTPAYYYDAQDGSVDAFKIVITGSGFSGRTLRLGVLYGVTHDLTGQSFNLTLTQTGGGNDRVTTPSLPHDGTAMNVAWFNITGAVDGETFIVTSTASNNGLEHVAGITFDSALTASVPVLPEVAGTTRQAYYAPLEVCELFKNNGVLQRGMLLPVWGWDDPGTVVNVQFDGQTVQGTADATGRWEAQLQPLTANATPQNMTITAGADSITIQNLLIGEVWLCSGQSNMEMDFNGTSYSADLPASVDPANYSLIRHMKVDYTKTLEAPEEIMAEPQERFLPGKVGSWTICNGTTYADFTAVGFFFAQQLSEELNVPVGLLNITRGNTRIDRWMSLAGAQQITDEVPLEDLDGAFGNPPFIEFNTTISPAAGFPMKGAIWYQGEANGNEGDSYYWKMTALVQGWRDVWSQGNFPFYYAQLPSYNGNPDWAPIREAQRKALGIANTGMAVLTDSGDTVNDFPVNLHPSNKYEVGKRLSLWARAKDYGETTLVHSGPLFQSAILQSGTAVISFDHVGSGLQAAKKSSSFSIDPPAPVANLLGFELAGADGQWYPATATIQGATVVLSSAAVPTPASARYNYATDAEDGTLYNLEGLPGAPFLETVTTLSSAPDTPTNLIASPGVSRVDLSWDVSNLAASYNVKRSTTQGGSYTTIGSPATNSFADTTATNGTTYYYVVSAVNAIGESADSNEASATPETLTTAPPTPTGLNATAWNARVDLSWSAAATAASYKVKRSTTQGGSYTPIGTPTTTSFADTTATNGTTYYYVVSAVNINGESADSSEASATPEEPLAAPDSPTGLGATAGDARVDLGWNVSSLASSYNVKRATTQGGSYTTIGSPTTNSFADTTAANGTTYYYVVSAVNATGESGNSSEVSATPVAPVPPATPTGLNAIAGNARVDLTWNVSATATSYNVKRSTTQGGSYGTIGTPTSAIYADTTAANGTTYYYVVSAVNGFGESADSSEANATPEVPSSNPTVNSASFNAAAGSTAISTSGTLGFGYASYDAPNFFGTFGSVANGTAYDGILFGDIRQLNGDYTVSTTNTLINTVGGTYTNVNVTEGIPGSPVSQIDSRQNASAFTFDGNASYGGFGGFSTSEQDVWSLIFNDLGVGTFDITLYLGHTNGSRLFDIDYNLAGVTATTTMPSNLSTLHGATVAGYPFTYTISVTTTSATDDLILTFGNGAGSGGSGTGYLAGYTVVAAGGPSNTFADWIGGYDVGVQTGLNQDPDGDGVDSGVENYFGTDPSASSGGLVTGTVDTGANTFTFTHPLNDTPASDLTATYRWSTDLATFYNDGDSNGAGTTTVNFVQGEPSGGMVTVTATIAGTVIPEKLFVDVKVTQP